MLDKPRLQLPNPFLLRRYSLLMFCNTVIQHSLHAPIHKFCSGGKLLFLHASKPLGHQSLDFLVLLFQSSFQFQHDSRDLGLGLNLLLQICDLLLTRGKQPFGVRKLLSQLCDRARCSVAGDLGNLIHERLIGRPLFVEQPLQLQALVVARRADLLDLQEVVRLSVPQPVLEVQDDVRQLRARGPAEHVVVAAAIGELRLEFRDRCLVAGLARQEALLVRGHPVGLKCSLFLQLCQFLL
mmetsp:Transcript_98980/g.317400  ORF Transcript_98980/g.317400 Transcript_98980/m.317400 type:complete len:239 (-) Transcript_98980:907-1623(-)